jgi:hypothetical protein
MSEEQFESLLSRMRTQQASSPSSAVPTAIGGGAVAAMPALGAPGMGSMPVMAIARENAGAAAGAMQSAAGLAAGAGSGRSQLVVEALTRPALASPNAPTSTSADQALRQELLRLASLLSSQVSQPRDQAGGQAQTGGGSATGGGGAETGRAVDGDEPVAGGRSTCWRNGRQHWQRKRCRRSFAHECPRVRRWTRRAPRCSSIRVRPLALRVRGSIRCGGAAGWPIGGRCSGHESVAGAGVAAVGRGHRRRRGSDAI